VPNHLADIPLEQVVPDAPTSAPPSASAPSSSGACARCPWRPSPAVTSSAPAGRTTSAAAPSAASRCRRGCASGPPARAHLHPSTKAAVGDHDENVSFEHIADLIGASSPARIRDLTLRIYAEAAAYALTRGIIIADTKFEFGLDDDGTLHLIDEALTPDSSRFWPADQYQPGQQPAQLRQAIRPRLPGDPGLGQDPARPGTAGGGSSIKLGPHRGEVREEDREAERARRSR
jgi:phosphoribosylaminoimidazole-succinocarboxamide synthase